MKQLCGNVEYSFIVESVILRPRVNNTSITKLGNF
jgi:hypothetical protein